MALRVEQALVSEMDDDFLFAGFFGGNAGFVTGFSVDVDGGDLVSGAGDFQREWGVAVDEAAQA